MPCQPGYRLPPYTLQQRIMTLSETVDWSLKLYGIQDRWKQSRGAGVRVAVLDTGYDDAHPDLQQAVVAARDFTRSRYGVRDVNGHGTHCAGVIGARENGVGMIGIAPETELLIGKVLGDSGAGTGQAVAEGIRWGVQQGAQVISMSLGGPQPDELIGRAIEAAVSAGVFVLCAAGNTGRENDVNFPARWKGRPRPERDTIAVAAVDREGRVAPFSSRGPEVDIAAPGVEIVSAFPGGGYAELSGTSMATPFVAGVVALVLAYHATGEHATPLRTMADLREHLRRTARDAGAAGPDDEYGLGLIHPEQMLASFGDEAAAKESLLRLVIMQGDQELASWSAVTATSVLDR